MKEFVLPFFSVRFVSTLHLIFISVLVIVKTTINSIKKTCLKESLEILKHMLWYCHNFLQNIPEFLEEVPRDVDKLNCIVSIEKDKSMSYLQLVKQLL